MHTSAIHPIAIPAATRGPARSVEAIYRRLMECARFPGDPRTLAFAGTLANGVAAGTEPLLRGLDEAEFQRLMRCCFPGMALHGGSRDARDALDEYDDLVDLLMEHRVECSDVQTWLCHAVASAALRDNHLWQDMGLPSRAVLSQLMTENFPRLAALNCADMKWKKFFYRQLCERTGVMICKSPNCRVCTDYAHCFGPEEGAALVVMAGKRDT